MAGPLARYFKRSVPTLLFITLFIFGLFAIWRKLGEQFYQVSELSGWLLFSFIILLVIYNIRKKISMLPLGRVWFWRHLHTWVGWLSLAVFFIHSGWQPPAGYLNTLLWVFMLIIFISGIFGLLIGIILPRRITRGEGRVQLERIPRIRAGLLRKADHLIGRLAKNPGTEPLTGFYTKDVRQYLFKSREFFSHCFNSANQARKLTDSLTAISRYIDKPSIEQATQLHQIIEDKHRLDRQYSMQQILRMWSYVHVAFSMSLLLLVAMHIIVIYAYHLEISF